MNEDQHRFQAVTDLVNYFMHERDCLDEAARDGGDLRRIWEDGRRDRDLLQKAAIEQLSAAYNDDGSPTVQLPGIAAWSERYRRNPTNLHPRGATQMLVIHLIDLHRKIYQELRNGESASFIEHATYLGELLRLLERNREEPNSSTPPPPAQRANGPAPVDPFADFIGKQRKLLLLLNGKERVPIAETLKELYCGDSRKKREALNGVVKRANKKLATNNEGREIKKRGDYLSLKPV